MNNQSAKGIALIAIGAVIALPLLGVALGGIIKFLFPFILVGLGVIGWRNGSRIIGGLMIGIGGLVLFDKFQGVIMLVIALALVAYGVSIIKGRRHN